MDSIELRALRKMAWERAKGELQGIPHTYRPSGDEELYRKYETFKKMLEEFIQNVEENDLL